MGCKSCQNRQKLLSRTFKKLIGRTDNKVSVKTLKSKSDCDIKVRLTSNGYVAKCLTHGNEGEPSFSPETATVNCEKQNDSTT